MSNGTSILVQGRIVWANGDLFKGKQQVDYNTRQPKMNPDGTPVVEYGFGIAVAKTDQNGGTSQEYAKVWETLNREALTLYPGGQLPPDFSLKLKDGDGIDSKGQPFSNREGHAGHVIIACTTRIPVKYFIYQNGENQLVTEGIKVGDYVEVQLNVKAHPAIGNGKPGLYLNPYAVRLVTAGKAIINTPSGNDIFGQTQPSYAGTVVPDERPAMPQQPGQNNTYTQAQEQQYNAMTQGVPAQAAPPVADPNYNVLPATHQPSPGTANTVTAPPVTNAPVNTPVKGGMPPIPR